MYSMSIDVCSTSCSYCNILHKVSSCNLAVFSKAKIIQTGCGAAPDLRMWESSSTETCRDRGHGPYFVSLSAI